MEKLKRRGLLKATIPLGFGLITSGILVGKFEIDKQNTRQVTLEELYTPTDKILNKPIMLEAYGITQILGSSFRISLGTYPFSNKNYRLIEEDMRYGLKLYKKLEDIMETIKIGHTQEDMIIVTGYQNAIAPLAIPWIAENTIGTPAFDKQPGAIHKYKVMGTLQTQNYDNPPEFEIQNTYIIPSEIDR